MKIEKDEITIRDFTETDLPLMFKWLTDKRVLEYYEGRDVRFTMDTLSAHFLEEIPDGFRMIIEYKKSPIGYAQAYQLSGELFDEYDYPDDGHIVFAMDQFIGEPKYFCRYFYQAVHKTPIEYLNFYRVERACFILDTESCSVGDAAYRCGFNDLGYFIRTFKKMKGITPKKYSKRGAL